MAFLYRDTPLPRDADTDTDFTLSTEEVRQVLIRSLYVMSHSRDADGGLEGRRRFYLDQRPNDFVPWYSISASERTLGQHVFAHTTALRDFRQLMGRDVAVQWRVRSDEIRLDDDVLLREGGVARRLRFQAILSPDIRSSQPLTRRPVEVLAWGEEFLSTVIPGRGADRNWDGVIDRPERDVADYVSQAVEARWDEWQEAQARRLREQEERAAAASDSEASESGSERSGSESD